MKELALILDAIRANRLKLLAIGNALDTKLDEGKSTRPDKDSAIINSIFAAIDCLKEAETYISEM